MRFTNLLMAIDEMGLRYYSGTDNDTMENTMYHFNNFISLICGIFDSLAIETRDRFHIAFKDDRYPNRTSLNKKAGAEFLSTLKTSKPDVWSLINKNEGFISVIYKMRERIIHRKKLLVARFHYDGEKGERWTANVIDLSEAMDVFKEISSWTVGSKQFEPLTEWGIYSGFGRPSAWSVLSPYDFAKAAATKMAEFCDSCLELLGFSNYVETSDPHDSLLEDISILRVYGIGF